VFLSNLLLFFYVYLFQLERRYQKSINRSKHRWIWLDWESMFNRLSLGTSCKKEATPSFFCPWRGPDVKYKWKEWAWHSSVWGGLVEISSRGHRGSWYFTFQRHYNLHSSITWYCLLYPDYFILTNTNFLQDCQILNFII
jgi:hypothetical protein